MDAKAVAEALWKVMDDIDTADDFFRSDDAAFRKYVRNKVGERFNYITSDGYRLEWVKTTPPKPGSGGDK